jgi:hypothetical protein
MPTVKKVTSVAKPAAKKPAVPKPVAMQAAEAPVMGRLITPTHVASETKVTPPVAPRPEPAPMPVSSTPMAPAADAPGVPAFDPSQAVIEQFGVVSDGALDKFVRDFEMQDARPRRRRPARPTETPSYGAEAPQTP